MKNLLLLLYIALFFIGISCANKDQAKKSNQQSSKPLNFIATLDSVWTMEQIPIRKRDSVMRIHGDDSELFKKYQAIYKKNHIINEKKVRYILDTYGWPTKAMAGEDGNWTICNVLQHSSIDVRVKYLPMMEQAVKDKKLEPRFLVRAADRIATDNNELQIYGGQVKYYPETKSFNLWPIKDPANVNKIRAEIGMNSIEEFLKQKRVPLEWNVEEQIKRTEAFIEAKRQNIKQK
ncbi:DUF6624 domain-containing protein [Algibacter sp. PT7-4]|uniref:DUF6624 domain-containing protein n=1 Tax=Algibacter ulvanivorans TaxID=3400999 RepID=UPI003AB098D6